MACLHSVVSFIVSACFISTALSSDWSYSGKTGPKYWWASYPTCDGESQSPINIFEGDVTTTTYSQWQTKNTDTAKGIEWSLTNTGHAAQVTVSGDTHIELSGGGLPGNSYRVTQFHFHWGSKPGQGSEHHISTHRYAMELHIVLYNTKYEDFNEAQTEEEGLAVLSFLHVISDTDNSNYDELVEKLEDIPEEDDTTELTALPLDSILPSALKNLTHFYRYTGSLTTPGCYETVTWTVFKDVLTVSRQQLEAFRTLKFSDGTTMENNFRPVQPHNGREITASFTPDVEWGYLFNGANHWAEYYRDCGGKSQSPIAITNARSQFDDDFPELKYKDYDKSSGFTMELENSGHAAQINLEGDHDISISGGDLPQSFRAEQFHLHWGSQTWQGSEHTIEGVAAPAELHVVHYGKSFGSFDAASTEPDGLAVLSFLFKLSKKDNPALDPIISNLPNIEYPGDTFRLAKPFSMNSLLPSNRDKYYRYLGSLTTPGCYESVIWTVFEATIDISRKQLKALRRLKSSENYMGEQINLENNFRPVQYLHGRTVTRNFRT